MYSTLSGSADSAGAAFFWDVGGFTFVILGFFCPSGLADNEPAKERITTIATKCLFIKTNPDRNFKPSD
jgi:hypothetical protein